MILKSEDSVFLEYCGLTVPAKVLLASKNGRSLLLSFDALLGKHAGAMPVLMGDDGVFRSTIDDQPVQISRLVS
jgi:hypothetical protein